MKKSLSLFSHIFFSSLRSFCSMLNEAKMRNHNKLLKVPNKHRTKEKEREGERKEECVFNHSAESKWKNKLWRMLMLNDEVQVQKSMKKEKNKKKYIFIFHVRMEA